MVCTHTLLQILINGRKLCYSYFYNIIFCLISIDLFLNVVRTLILCCLSPSVHFEILFLRNFWLFYFAYIYINMLCTIGANFDGYCPWRGDVHFVGK